jgi:hypothetical protein
MQRFYSSVYAAMAIALSACGQSSESGKGDASKAEAPRKQDTVFDDLVDTKERARQGAEQAVQQSKERIDAALEADEAKRAQ